MYQFHMRGEDMGVLRAIILHIDDTESVVLEHDRPKGDKWNMAVASVFTTRPFQVKKSPNIYIYMDLVFLFRQTW